MTGFLALTADAARWAILVVLGLAAIEKGLTLRSRSARWHPVVMANHWLQAHASTWMVGSLGADLAGIVLLLTWPEVGAVFFGCLLSVYTAVGTRVHSTLSESCRCFWRWLNARRAEGLLLRNVLLAMMSVMVILFFRGSTSTGILWALPLLALTIGLTRLGERLWAKSSRKVLGPRSATLSGGGSHPPQEVVAP